ncbi:MAG TPA: MFS transporter [Mycobacteriales bacterium]|nr:MFS transporter [Mycobacteriales bacterium]
MTETSDPAPPTAAAEPAVTRAALWRRFAADVTPLRESADYRRWWIGIVVSFTGTQLTQVALPLQVYAITKSSVAVGLIGAVVLVPFVLSGLIGGAVADAVDRRRLTLLTGSALTVVSALLAVQAALGLRQLWLLYVLAAVQGAFASVDSAARGAMLPRLVRREMLPSANALGQLGFNGAMTVGPLLAGLLVAAVGFTWTFALDAASFAAILCALWRLPAMPPEGGSTRAGLRSVAEGLRFLGPRKNLLMTFLVDINAMVFGMPRALFPAVGVHWFHGGASTVGLLYAAPPLGAFLGAALSGWSARVRRQGLAVLVSVSLWGGAIAAFGLSRTLWLSLLFLAVAGAADMVSAVFRNTILQVATPDSLRGRLQGVFIVVVAGGPRLGDVESGTVAGAFGLGTSVVSGGLACIAGVAALAAAYPSFAKYDARQPVP